MHTLGCQCTPQLLLLSLLNQCHLPIVLFFQSRLPTAVFDGHGGFAAAEYLQQNLYRIFKQVLDAKGEGETSGGSSGTGSLPSLTAVLTDSFKAADEDVLQWMHGEPPARVAAAPVLRARQGQARVYPTPGMHARGGMMRRCSLHALRGADPAAGHAELG